MARDGMADPISRWRRMVDDQEQRSGRGRGAGLLDTFRTDIYAHELTPRRTHRRHDAIQGS